MTKKALTAQFNNSPALSICRKIDLVAKYPNIDIMAGGRKSLRGEGCRLQHKGLDIPGGFLSP